MHLNISSGHFPPIQNLLIIFGSATPTAKNYQVLRDQSLSRLLLKAPPFGRALPIRAPDQKQKPPAGSLSAALLMARTQSR